jgi:uncharacterized damage-inducible protein DinB
MDIRTIKLLAEYNEKTNVKMDRILSALKNDQWEEEFEGYFRSIKALCNHIYVCDFNWLKRFSNLRQFRYVQSKFFEQTMRFDVMLLTDLEDYIDKRENMDNYIDRFVDEIRTEDLEKELKYIDSHGKEYRRVFGGLVLHMFNHETHHRGMISIYLENMRIDNDYSNLMEIL